MDPISLTMGVVGLGMSIFGALNQSSSSSAYAKQVGQLENAKAAASMNVTNLEQNEDDVRRQAMMLNSHRQSLETIRQAQLARSMALQAGSTQTGNVSSNNSGVQGGLAQIEDAKNYAIGGINQQVQFGNQMFDYNRQITANRIQMAQIGAQESTLQANYQSASATNQGIMSLGGAIMKAGPMVGPMAKGINFGGGGFNPFNVTGSLY